MTNKRYSVYITEVDGAAKVDRLVAEGIFILDAPVDFTSYHEPYVRRAVEKYPISPRQALIDAIACVDFVREMEEEMATDSRALRLAKHRRPEWDDLNTGDRVREFRYAKRAVEEYRIACGDEID